MGAVLHTLNLRLAAAEVAYIVDHARDKVILVDADLVPLLARALPRADAQVERFVVIGDGDARARSASRRCDYEALLADARARLRWPELDENDAAAMCYTSGTTGQPKGVVYSHRSTYLHSMAQCMGSALGISERDTVLPIVPMFHANAWGLPYAAWMSGADLALPGALRQRRAGICRLIGDARPTLCAGVPTVFRDMLAHGETQRRRPLVAARDLVRRLGRARGAHRRLREALRRADLPGLGHDRDLAAGGAGHPAQARRRPQRRCSIAP